MLAEQINKERPLCDVPVSVMLLLFMAMGAQLLWHSQQPLKKAMSEDLTAPMSVNAYKMLSLNEPIATSKLLNLWLQAFDNQPGLSLSYQQLDYGLITQWLDLILSLDPKGAYPMLVAARVYGSVTDKGRQRIMLDYIYKKFNQEPNRHWRWLAHATTVAKHDLKDLPLALSYAQALTEKATASHVPYWARDMHFILLEDMGEIETAKVLVGALIASGEITDPFELNFLSEKIQKLEEISTK